MNNRVVPVILLGVLALGCCAAGIAFSVLRGRPAPTRGLALTYACPEPVAAADAPRIEARLDEVDAWGRVEVVDPSRVRVSVAGDEVSEYLASALTRSRALELRPVDEAAMRALVQRPLPPGVTSEGASSSLVTLTAANAAVLAQIQPLLPAGDALVLACDDPEPGCRGYVVSASELGNAEIARADASYDDIGGGASVGLTLTAEGAARFESLTARITSSRLAIVLDGHAVSVPVVQERIAGGRVMITLGAGRTAGSALPEAQAIAAALGNGRLSCTRWTLETETTFGP